MDNLIVNINKSSALQKINDTAEYTLNMFCDDIRRNNKKTEELKDKLKLCERNRVELARAYAKKLKVLIG